MDIYVTDLKTDSRFRFPMLPESISLTSGANFHAFQIIGVGDVKLPSGEQLTGVSWSGKLPGGNRKNDPYIKEWTDPKAVQSIFGNWQSQKEKLRLLITETPINIDVYISSFSMNYAGGYGDYDYNISFTQAKELKVYVSGVSGQSTSTAATSQNNPQGQQRPTAPGSGTHTVVKGDCLWAIAQKYMGSGSKYPQLYEANKSVIDPVNQKYGNPRYTIYPGQVLTIPQ